MRKILIAAFIGLVLGFLAAIVTFALRLIHLDPSTSSASIFVSISIASGTLGALIGVTTWYFFKTSQAVGKGLLWGIAFYWILIMALSLMSIFILNLHPDIGYLPNIPGEIFFGILKPFLVEEKPFHLWDHPYIEFLIITVSWFSYGIIGSGIAYFFSRKS